MLSVGHRLSCTTATLPLKSPSFHQALDHPHPSTLPSASPPYDKALDSQQWLLVAVAIALLNQRGMMECMTLTCVCRPTQIDLQHRHRTVEFWFRNHGLLRLQCDRRIIPVARFPCSVRWLSRIAMRAVLDLE